jgi:hypothetical protein
MRHDHVVGNKPLPVNVRQDIIERTDGIPLFVEEMTKAVSEAVIKEQGFQLWRLSKRDQGQSDLVRCQRAGGQESHFERRTESRRKRRTDRHTRLDAQPSAVSPA